MKNEEDILTHKREKHFNNQKQCRSSLFLAEFVRRTKLEKHEWEAIKSTNFGIEYLTKEEKNEIDEMFKKM